ncbi:MAG TPA: MltA domain-containing protein [Caulobacteraceae bacterium]|jgi:membrane-bound lytic murein transglycosylase A|nr:MltA domain-containing protein [Caulobacteraceae bacterium]
MRRGGRRALLGLSLPALGFLAACATTQPARQTHSPPRPASHLPPTATAPTPVHAAPRAAALPLASLPGWTGEDHAAAFAAYRSTCQATRLDPDDCQAARKAGTLDDPAAAQFFEDRFQAEPLDETGLLTGYFAPEYEARSEPDEIFSAPVRPRPDDLKRGGDGKFMAYLTRAEIEAQPGKALAFMRPEDLFFLQIQGSGYLMFPDGHRLRAAYAADNGQPFRGIATPLADRHLLKPNETSGDGIRQWLADHRGDQARAITDLDPRYVFFALEPDDGGQPKGSAGIPLPAGRAVAVDHRVHEMGELLWIQSEPGTFAATPYHRLVVALDEGGAIKGAVRADLYTGRGDAAGREAGRIKQPLKLWMLTPKHAD